MLLSYPHIERLTDFQKEVVPQFFVQRIICRTDSEKHVGADLH